MSHTTKWQNQDENLGNAVSEPSKKNKKVISDLSKWAQYGDLCMTLSLK